MTQTLPTEPGFLSTHKRNYSWVQDVIDHILFAFEPGDMATGGDVRLALTEKGIPDPGHNNAWGVAIREARRRGYLIPTGRLILDSRPKFNSTANPEYVIARPKR